MHVVDISVDEGSIFGYVCGSTELNIARYFAEHSVDGMALHQALAQYGRPVALLRNLHVDDIERGRGIGRRLMKSFMSEPIVRGAGAILLIVDQGESQNEGFNLANWYSSLGFKVAAYTGSGEPIMANDDRLITLLQALIAPTDGVAPGSRCTPS